MRATATGRYRGAVAGSALLLAVGLLTGAPWILGMAAVPLGFVAFAAVSGVPDPALSAERQIDPPRPIPGDRVTVSLTVANESSNALPDVRIFEGLPDAVDPDGGSATAATAIAPEGSATLEYEFTAVRGEHEFEPPVVRLRGASADAHRDLEPTVAGAERVAARVFVDEPPIEREASTLVGTATADAGGSGVEFHTTREYRPGDPINRIDWHRLGRDGELSTVNYREQRGQTVVVVVDYRPAVRDDRAGDRCLYAADRMVQALDRGGQSVGLAVLDDDAVPWIAPGETDVLARTRLALRAVDDRAAWNGPLLAAADGGRERDVAAALADRLAGTTRVVLVTPATDDLPLRFREELQVRGHSVAVVTPAPATPSTPGERLVAADRDARLRRLRAASVDVVDWDRRDPLPVAIDRTEVRARS